MTSVSQHRNRLRRTDRPSIHNFSAMSTHGQSLAALSMKSDDVQGSPRWHWKSLVKTLGLTKRSSLYAPHETNALLLKTLLVSFWIGVDTIIAFLLLTTPSITTGQRNTLSIILIATAVCGTVFSLLLAWSTGADLGGQATDKKMAMRLMRSPLALTGAALAIAIALSAILSVTLLRYQKLAMENAGMASLRVKPEDTLIWKQCTEVARLEQLLFQSNERTAMASCLLQYDVRYALPAVSKSQ